MTKSPEADLQKAVCQHLKLRAKPGVVWFHVPNGLKSEGRHVKRMKAMGLRPGVADLVIMADSRAYCLELKAPKGKQTEAQELFQVDCAAASVPYAVASSLAIALDRLRDWGVING